jgi:predicted DNA-binding transcriptional regulator AlpA
MQNQKTYTSADMTRDFNMSLATLYRRVKEAREGLIDFPLPIQTGPKKSLLWSAESVRNFLQNGSDASQTTQALKIESGKSKEMRHREAMARLERKGVKTARTK